jgi:uncharacterized membrane protein YeaQ/YmgE (transglycosylase-associated protein family)
MDGIIGFLGWLIIGAIIGWIAGKIWAGHGFGLIGNIIVGIVGSSIGGFLFGWLFGTSGNWGLDLCHSRGHCVSNHCWLY